MFFTKALKKEKCFHQSFDYDDEYTAIVGNIYMYIKEKIGREKEKKKRKIYFSLSSKIRIK